MNEISREEALERIHEIARKHNLKPSILRDVIEGRSQGWSQRKIARFYGHNKNTISKYSKKLDEEMDEISLAELLLLGAILVGGTMFIKKILEEWG